MYVKLIQANRRTLEEVPEKYREQVEQALQNIENGGITNG